MAASLLNAIGLPELITTTLEAYEQMAVDLTTHPEKMASIKHKLVDNRLTTPLFDTKLFTKHIETAYKAILLLLLTGARRNEITHARWEHVDLEASTLLVPLSKSGKPRHVFLNGAAIDVLRSVTQLPGNPFVFPSPVTARPCASLYFPWHRIRTKAGLLDVRLHDLRHSFASALVNDGRELYTVQRLLGHANAKATQRYAHLSRETLAEAVEAMGNLVGPILEAAPKSACRPIGVLKAPQCKRK